jgi:hypothetical protein
VSKKIEFEAEIRRVVVGPERAEFIEFEILDDGFTWPKSNGPYRVTLEPSPRALLPCPFCGGEVSFYEYGMGPYFSFQHDASGPCPMEQVHIFAKSETAAIENWNRRAS